MTNEPRGGNSRLLAKTLDSLNKPTAILDRRSQIVFVNSALCTMAGAEATVLVGKQCSWDLESDTTPHVEILTALAPPQAAREGAVAARQLSTPVVFGSDATGQLFVPIMDEDHLVQMMIVVFGDWEELHIQAADANAIQPAMQREMEETLLNVRSRWKQLDGLHALVGDSPAIKLAMVRAQMATSVKCNTLISGPIGVGASDIARGIFVGRLRSAGIAEVSGQSFPIDCQVLESGLFDGMLEVFAGRISSDSPPLCQQLVLENLDFLQDASLQSLTQWLGAQGERCVVVGTSSESASDLASRSANWSLLTASIAETEITIPSLRHRRADIPPLIQRAVAHSCRTAERAILKVSPDAMDLLQAFNWPRNLVQLDAAIETAVKHAVLTATIQTSHLPVEVRTFPGSVAGAADTMVDPISLDALMDDVERIVLQRALKLSPRNRAQIARWLGISRPRLLRRISQLGLDDGLPLQ